MKTRLRFSDMRDSLRTQLWPVPLAAAIVAVVLGQLMPALDRQVDENLPEVVSGILFGGGPEAAQALTQTIAGSLVTVTSLTFSLTVVTLQLASSQFSPRLLRTFSRDKFVHNTLGLFLATFVFTLTVLRSIRAETSEGEGFVPKISMTVAFGLTVASVMALVFFLAHLARQIRVETMMRDVHSEAGEAIDRVFPKGDDTPPIEVDIPRSAGRVVESAASGFLLSVDADALLAAAVETNSLIIIDAVPGDSLIEGIPFARVWSVDDGILDNQRMADLVRRINSSASIGFERTSTRDAGFGLQQLLDVASRALSPGVNDPTTAVHAIGHISAVLCSLATRQTGPKAYADEEGRQRVVVGYPPFTALLDQVMVQMLRYAADDPRTARRLARLLRELGWVADGGPHRAAIARQITALRTAIAATEMSEEERRALLRECDASAAAGKGSWRVL